MALAGFNTFLRVIIGLIAGAIFGIDQYFLYLYRNNDTLVYHWRFYSQIAISGLFFLLVVISEIVYRISRYNDRSNYVDGGWGGEPLKTKRSCLSQFWTIFRFVCAMILVAGTGGWVIPAWWDKQRLMFNIPVGRNTPEAAAYRTGPKSHDWVNPNNIFDCPSWRDGDLVTNLCKFDQQVLYTSAGVAAFAFFEAILTVIIQSRRRRVNYINQPYVMDSYAPGTGPNAYNTLTAGHVVPMDNLNTNKAVTKEEEGEPKSIFRSLKEHIRRDEVYDVESNNNYGSSGYNPNSTYAVEARHVGHEYTDRSLPPLPARPTNETEEERCRREEEEEEVRSDSAMIPKSLPMIAGPVPTGTNPFLNEDQLQQQQLAYAQAAGGSSQSPYHAADVKRADGY
ncbi:hypothetical protein BGZ96_009084 [Linnemannia gamsii]|uniref:Uncharacterized protein n=1 Tax=Linnemannia gamsii TaxID=64522 RepID=A0ABQ7JXU0_9FUNG|nr:hypothetical protein BGZ96_009084 [Linnemannia gamsii]